MEIKLGKMEIQERLLELLKTDEAKALANVGIAGISVKYPIAAVFLTAAHEIAGLADKMRFIAVAKGLSTELNQEEQINILYNYVDKSEENAFYVANTLRKALLADSQVACTIMGKMLACHAKQGNAYDQDDNIIFRALETATDEDIRLFTKAMQEYKTPKGTFRIPLDELDSHLFATMGWGEFNRLFYGPSGGIAWTDADDAGFDTSHSPTAAAERLFEYISSMKQILEYGKDV